MKEYIQKILLFSVPTEKNSNDIHREIFPKQIENKIFAYMPSDGDNNPEKFTNTWKNIARENNAEFLYINNCGKNSKKEIEKLNSANILLITGGNTFALLDKLKRTGLDRAIKNFVKKNNFVLSGFSAGALVLTPNIKVCNLDKYDANEVGIEDYTAIGIVDFEVFPHYTEEDWKIFTDYSKSTENTVRRITDDEYIVVNY